MTYLVLPNAGPGIMKFCDTFMVMRDLILHFLQECDDGRFLETFKMKISQLHVDESRIGFYTELDWEGP